MRKLTEKELDSIPELWRLTMNQPLDSCRTSLLDFLGNLKHGEAHIAGLTQNDAIAVTQQKINRVNAQMQRNRKFTEEELDSIPELWRLDWDRPIDSHKRFLVDFLGKLECGEAHIVGLSQEHAIAATKQQLNRINSQMQSQMRSERWDRLFGEHGYVAIVVGMEIISLILSIYLICTRL